MALAAEIEATRPDLVGVQEAVLVRTQFPADGAATPATAVALDYLQILMVHAGAVVTDEVVVQRDGLDVELPMRLASMSGIPTASPSWHAPTCPPPTSKCRTRRPATFS